MSIKTRLVISYIAMTIIPIILSILAAVAIIFFSNRITFGTYDLKFETNPLRDIRRSVNQVFSNLEKDAYQNPDKLKNHTYLKAIDEQLKKTDSGIIVRKDAAIIYSSEIADKLNIKNNLPAFNPDYRKTANGLRLFDNGAIMERVDFYFYDNSRGSVYLVTDTERMTKLLISNIVLIIIAILIILTVTDGVLSFIMSKQILTPLGYLKKSALRIKEGDLDFKIKSESKDEIGEVCLAFEEMRAKLKESIDMQNQYENNRKELISNISHDLKTPITAIKGYVEGIMDGVADTPEKMDKYIKTIYTKAADLDKLIEELFLFSKLDTSKEKYDFENINIEKYLSDSFEELEFDLEKVGVKLCYNSSVNYPLIVKADREKIKRVIINIINNAVKYMDKSEGVINIRLSETDDYAVIRIEDNGMGIPQDEIPKVFNRFYRVEPSRNAETGGSGLGLAIAELIINEHGGKIWIESKENIGTSVFFTLKKCNKSL